MNNISKGKFYIFFGPSGIGKDYLLEKFIAFGENNGILIAPVPRSFTRLARKNEKDDQYHSYNKNADYVCNDDNFYANINGEYVGINRQKIKSALDLGGNLALVTGSIHILQQIIHEYIDHSDDVCLIYTNAPGINLNYYLELEKFRNPEQDEDTIYRSAHERWAQSQRIADYYNHNSELFNYAYLNITKNAVSSMSVKYNDVFFEEFFKTIVEGENKSGPNWVSLRENIANNSQHL